MRGRTPFYEPGRPHEDTDAAYEILRDHRFGFVHQVLSFTRTDNDSVSSRVRAFHARGLDKLLVILRHGSSYLDEEELRRCLADHERKYYRLYVRHGFGSGGAAFRRFHRDSLAAAGYRLSGRRLARAALREATDLVFNPKQTASRIWKRCRNGHRPTPGGGS